MWRESINHDVSLVRLIILLRLICAITEKGYFLVSVLLALLNRRLLFVVDDDDDLVSKRREKTSRTRTKEKRRLKRTIYEKKEISRAKFKLIAQKGNIYI